MISRVSAAHREIEIKLPFDCAAESRERLSGLGARGAKRLEVDIMLMLLVRDGRIILADSVPTDQAASDRFWA